MHTNENTIIHENLTRVPFLAILSLFVNCHLRAKLDETDFLPLFTP